MLSGFIFVCKFIFTKADKQIPPKTKLEKI